jgi:hypothetical protein
MKKHTSIILFLVFFTLPLFSSTYEIISGNFSWNEALIDASQRGGHLAVLNTEEKISTVQNYLNNLSEWPEFYIGLSDQMNEGNWRWIDGTTLTASNWMIGEPSSSSNLYGEENYAVVVSSKDSANAGKWDDNSAIYFSEYIINHTDEVGGYLIEYPADTDGDGLWDRYETNTGIYVSSTDTGTDPNLSDTDEDGLSDFDEVVNFSLIGGYFTLEEARLNAISRGGHLATIASIQELNKFTMFLDEIEYRMDWRGLAIGGTDQNSDYVLGWLIGELATVGTDQNSEGVLRWVIGEPWTIQYDLGALAKQDPVSGNTLFNFFDSQSDQIYSKTNRAEAINALLQSLIDSGTSPFDAMTQASRIINLGPAPKAEFDSNDDGLLTYSDYLGLNNTDLYISLEDPNNPILVDPLAPRNNTRVQYVLEKPYSDPHDPDSDDDGVLDNADALPNDPNESADLDNDGVGDNADTDDDNDGKIDELDIDDDNDGIADSYDPFPLVYDVSENVPSSLSGYVEIFFSDNYPGYGIWYGSGENSSINIMYEGADEIRFQDSYSWNSQNLTSTGYYGGGTFRTNFKNKTNDLFFKFTYVSESSELYADDSGKGFFYDGRIDLDKNGMADGEQITNGLPFPAANSIIDLANVYSSAESNLIPIQVLDYASNEKYFPSELKDLRPGSTMVEVSGNQATLQLQMEESSDLQTWEDKGDPATMTIPADTDTKFFRFKMAE